MDEIICWEHRSAEALSNEINTSSECEEQNTKSYIPEHSPIPIMQYPLFAVVSLPYQDIEEGTRLETVLASNRCQALTAITSSRCGTVDLVPAVSACVAMSTLLRTFRNLRKIGLKEYGHQMQYMGKWRSLPHEKLVFSAPSLLHLHPLTLFLSS